MSTADETVRQWLGARETLANVADEMERLEDAPEVASFHNQMSLLQRQLLADPRTFRDLFSAGGMQAVVEEFRQPDLDAEFTKQLWETLLRSDDASKVLMRFLWNLPVRSQRSFMRAIDAHLSDRYPMFKGLSEGWPASNNIGPYIREPEERSQDFDLVNQGYMGYMNLGYSLREVELFVWLEALRDKQCNNAPCELGALETGCVDRVGGCPVQIHIPVMFQLIGTGRLDEALAMLESCNPLPDVTGRVCPQELQCQGVCLHKHSMAVGQVEWFLPQWDKAAHPGAATAKLKGSPDPWKTATKPPVAIVGSGPSGLIAAFLLAVEGFPVTVFEAFHALGGVLRYGIPEFRLPNRLIDDVVEKIRLLGGRFVTNFVVGKTATLEQLREAGFARVFVGTGAGLPQFLNVPGEHLINILSANEFLTRVNLMHANLDEYETPLPAVEGKNVLVIGGGNTAMDAARTSRRLGGHVTIVYRRTRSEMPARVEELEHALEEGIELAVLRSPSSFDGDEQTGFVTGATVDIMQLGEPDESGRRRPERTGRTEHIPADLVIMALGNGSNPIIRDSTPDLNVSRRGAIALENAGSQETSIDGIFSGGDAARGGSTAILAAGDGQSAAREILAGVAGISESEIAAQVASALAYTDMAGELQVIVAKRHLSPGIEEFTVRAPAIARSAQAGQFVRVLANPNGELVPLTLADWDAEAGTICLVVQGMGTTSLQINQMQVGEAFTGIAGPLGRPSELNRFTHGETVVFTAGGLGLPPVYPIMREHLRLGNHVTLISGFRSQNLMFWTDEGERVPALQAEFGDLLRVIYATDDGSFGVHGFVTTPLGTLLEENKAGEGRPIAEVTTIGPPMMMRGVSDQTKPYGVRCVASLNSIMVDATGMCGACMVPVMEGDKLVRKHACIDGPELDSHSIDWDKFLPRFRVFKAQEQASRANHGL